MLESAPFAESVLSSHYHFTEHSVVEYIASSLAPSSLARRSDLSDVLSGAPFLTEPNTSLASNCVVEPARKRIKVQVVIQDQQAVKSGNPQAIITTYAVNNITHLILAGVHESIGDWRVRNG
jgi:hypothetical protein